MSKINLQSGILTVENRRSREKKNGYARSIGKQSGESVESPGDGLLHDTARIGLDELQSVA